MSPGNSKRNLPYDLMVQAALAGCQDPGEADHRYQVLFFRRLCCCLPKKSLWILSCKLQSEEVVSELN